MKIRKDYMIKYVESVPYLIPYGQDAAQKLNGVKLDDDGVILWNALCDGNDEAACVQVLARAKGCEEPTLEHQQYVSDFLRFLEGMEIIDRREHHLIGPLEDHDLFEIAGLTVMFNGPREYIPPELEPYRVDSAMQPVNYDDLETNNYPNLQRVEVILSMPRILGVGEILVRTNKEIIYVDENHYHYLFPWNQCVHEMRVRKNGTKVVIYASTEELTNEVIVREIYEAMYRGFLVFALSKGLYAFSSLSLQYRQKGYLLIEGAGEDWTPLANDLAALSHVKRCNRRTNLLELRDDALWMWNIPWGSITTDDAKFPMQVGGVILLRQSEDNHEVQKSPSDRILLMMLGLVSPTYSKELTESGIDFCTRVYTRVPIWRLHCSQTPDALEFVQQVVDESISS